MTRDSFCSLLPHGSAGSYTTPGRVSMALRGLMPGNTFCTSTPPSATEERVAWVAVMTIACRSSSPGCCWAGSSSAKAQWHDTASERAYSATCGRGNTGFIGFLAKGRDVALLLLQNSYTPLTIVSQPGTREVSSDPVPPSGSARALHGTRV